MSNKITVTVTGNVGTGKTTISTAIVKALKQIGFEVEYSDPDGPPVDFNKNATRIPEVRKHTKVIIKEKQALRYGDQ